MSDDSYLLQVSWHMCIWFIFKDIIKSFWIYILIIDKIGLNIFPSCFAYHENFLLWNIWLTFVYLIHF